MVFGDILSKGGECTLETADGISVSVGRNLIERIGLKVFGIPHIGLRCRAYCIFHFLNPVKNKKVLDAGCGIGLYSLTLAEKGNMTVGVDVNVRYILSAKKIASDIGIRAYFICADICNFPFRHQFFDIVLCSDVLEHIDDDELAFRNIAQVVKPGGMVVITVPDRNTVDDDLSKSMGHVRQGYGQNEICSLMEKVGLQPVKVIGYCGTIGKMAWKLNRKAFKSRLLTALTFLPLYALAIFDLYLNRGKPGIGWVIKAVKQVSN